MKFDFLKDPQTEAWCAQIRGEPYRRGPNVRLVEATAVGLLTGIIAICVYLAVNGA